MSSVGVLMVAEKPSLAESIAQILSGKSSHSRKAITKATQVHEWGSNSFPALGSRVAGRHNFRYKMTSVCGHVNSIDFPPKFNNWDKVAPESLFEAPCVKKEANPKLNMVHHLANEARGCSLLVLWLDCDKEGENICYEVIEAVEKSMNLHDKRSSPFPQLIFRAKFSAITAQEINQAFATLGEPNYLESLSVDARQELDLRVGCAFTRFQTKFFQGKYGDLDSNLISFGPCQTPTLGFCVQRHDQIQSFKPEAFWTLDVTCDNRRVKWSRVRSFDREVILSFFNEIKNEKEAYVLSVDTKEGSKKKPLPLNTTEMLRSASSGLGMSPHQTMAVAERLYTQGFISYPRTETTSYPASFDLKGTVDLLNRGETFKSVIDTIKLVGPGNNMSKPRKGSDHGDHPPITPTRSASPAQVGGGEAWKLYDFIVRTFLGSVSPDLLYLQTTIKYKVGSELFAASGKQELDPGFTVAMPWHALKSSGGGSAADGDDEDAVLTMSESVKPGQKVKVQEVSLGEHQTGPPDYLTESDIITLMEKHAIGTDASIPVHIKNICDRNYVTVSTAGGGSRKLVPTNLGIVLVHGYQKIDYELVSPRMRGAMEGELNRIASGESDFKGVVEHFVEIYRRKFMFFTSMIQNLDQLFEANFTTLAQTGRPHTRCGKCNRYLKLIESRPTRLHCGTCRDTYNIPQNGAVRIHKDYRCPLDNFELCYFTSNLAHFAFCPFCYNEPPFEDMPNSQTGCNKCTHPTCEHGMIANQWNVACSACACPLVLDPGHTGPKWRFCCSGGCGVVVAVCDGAERVSISQEKECDDCGARLLTVAYKENKTPFEDKKLTFTGCGLCSEILRKLIHMPSNGFKAMDHRGGRGGRGGGRGRGRGSRGGRGGVGPPRGGARGGGNRGR